MSEDVTNLNVSKFYHLDWHAVVCKGCDEQD